MFSDLQPAPPDPILGLSEAFRLDPNPQKINLSVGVFQDAHGRTPVLRSVREAAQRLAAEEGGAGYLSIGGDPEFGRRAQELLVGSTTDPALVTLQTPGGTGGLRVASEFLARCVPGRGIWVSQPTWANHPAVFAAAGLRVENYPYLDRATLGLDFSALLDCLRKIPRGDIVLLHGCCHNPTGVDPTLEEWETVVATLVERELLPLVDLAYQGFGDGLDEDAAATRMILANCPEALVVTSYSKTFGLYRERVGALTLRCADSAAARATTSQVLRTIRTIYSNPPAHGAAVVRTILGDASLRALWEAELAAMRRRIQSMRREFVAAMRERGCDLSALSRQRGMFSFSGLTPLQVDRLRNEHAIYIVGSGRINVAGMTEANLPRLCDAVAAVLTH